MFYIYSKGLRTCVEARGEATLPHIVAFDKYGLPSPGLSPGEKDEEGIIWKKANEGIK